MIAFLIENPSNETTIAPITHQNSALLNNSTSSIAKDEHSIVEHSVTQSNTKVGSPLMVKSREKQFNHAAMANVYK